MRSSCRRRLAPGAADLDLSGTLAEVVERATLAAERQAIAAALAEHGNDPRRTADALGVGFRDLRGAACATTAWARELSAPAATVALSARDCRRPRERVAQLARGTSVASSWSRRSPVAATKCRRAVHDLLVAADRGEHVGAAQAGHRRQRPEPIDQRADARAATSGGRDAARDAQRQGDAHAEADRLAVAQPAVAGRRLERVAGGVPEVEDPAQPALALVARHDARP